MGYKPQSIKRSVFRAYDIRGVIDADFNEDSFYTIGLAIAYRLNELNRQQIFIACDGRLTSPMLVKALMQGLLDSGIDVINLGAVATPVMYYATHAHDLDCGLMVTGSHNPANYNGIKMVLAGKTLTEKDIDILYDLVISGKRLHGQGSVCNLDIIDEYSKRVTQDICIKRRLKVVVDCGNGIAGPVIPRVLHSLGCEVIPLYCDVDGTFPNHHPDPTVEENLADLKQAVALHNADLGLAFDGDADRLGLITNRGEMIWPDRLMMLYSLELLNRVKGATIVFDVKCSSNLERVIREAGGIPSMCPTGHSIVKSIMKDKHAALAGEMSGHLFFKDRWYGFDDALYSACRLLEIIGSSELTVSEQFQLIPDSINTPEIKIDIADEDKFLFMKRFCAEASFVDARIISIDGLRAEFTSGWGLLRASNTTPCLIARFEAEDCDSLHSIQKLFETQIHRVDKNLIVPF